MARKRMIRPRGKCEICGALIPHKPGMPAKTCGQACAIERKRRRERERYYHVKDTPHWKTTRANYLAQLRMRLKADPDYAAIFYAYHREQNKRQRVKRNADPAMRARELAGKRKERAAWRAELVQDPHAWDAHKAKCRAWYQGLCEADYQRIFAEPRRQRRVVQAGDGAGQTG